MGLDAWKHPYPPTRGRLTALTREICGLGPDRCEAILFESLALLVYAATYWLWLHLFVILKEERDLREVLGAAYGAYCTDVPR